MWGRARSAPHTRQYCSSSAKLAEMGLSLKDSAPGFDPSAVVDSYDDDATFAEDEQY